LNACANSLLVDARGNNIPVYVFNAISTCLQYLFKEALTYHQQLRMYLQHKIIEHRQATTQNNSSVLVITTTSKKKTGNMSVLSEAVESEVCVCGGGGEEI
jgi:hypothetical protein